MFKKGHVTWNKGKKCPHLIGNQNGFKKGQRAWNKGGKATVGQMKSLIVFKKGHIPWNKGKKLPHLSGENSSQWKGGVAKDRAYRNKHHREYLLRRGKLYVKKRHQTRTKRLKAAGKLSIKTVQLVYEDNIKKYGTLTCIYCLEPILFGVDTLEHKIPLSRGGLNLYENLAVACKRCNSRKRSKTEEEYRKENHG